MTETQHMGGRATGQTGQHEPPSQSGFDFRGELVSHLPHLRAVARTLTGHRDRADDLVNDTVLKALSAEAQFQSGTHLKAWLMTILRNHYINGLKASGKFVPLGHVALDDVGDGDLWRRRRCGLCGGLHARGKH